MVTKVWSGHEDCSSEMLSYYLSTVPQPVINKDEIVSVNVHVYR